jgi:hypothetical protein
MPIKDPEKRRTYARELMRRLRAGKPSAKKQQEEKLKAARRKVRELRAELSLLRDRD